MTEKRGAVASSTPPSQAASNDSPGPSGTAATPGQVAAATRTAAANPATSVSAGAPAAARVSESIDDLARFVQLPVRPAAVVWQSGVMGKNEHPEIPGPSDLFLIAALNYPPADADRLVAAQRGTPTNSDVDAAPWFPAALGALAHPDDDSVQVLSGPRYDATSYTRRPFSAGALYRIGSSGWFVLVLSTT